MWRKGSTPTLANDVVTIQLNWIKCTNDVWCTLANVNLSHEYFQGLEGVYVIWHGGDGHSHNVVKVGQGVIADRLSSHRNDPEIQAYARNALYVTWAEGA